MLLFKILFLVFLVINETFSTTIDLKKVVYNKENEKICLEDKFNSTIERSYNAKHS
jgi:hypothetical protein